MVNGLRYRWDFIGLSTDEKPTPENSPKVVDGSTFYCSDTSKLYVWCKTAWYERTALGGGGTSDFNDLTNRPKYNGTAMTGTTDIPEVINTAFTGTDGTATGTAGLVPAPATTDAGKFLKADGTWNEVGGGGEPDYSETEVETPTKWIDGKTIYKMTIKLGPLTSSSSYAKSLTISNLYEIVDFKGLWHNTLGLTSATPLNYPATSNLTDAITTTVANNTIYVASSGRNGWTGYITIYYTKTN